MNIIYQHENPAPPPKLVSVVIEMTVDEWEDLRKLARAILCGSAINRWNEFMCSLPLSIWATLDKINRR